jgi:hypothetical protein
MVKCGVSLPVRTGFSCFTVTLQKLTGELIKSTKIFTHGAWFPGRDPIEELTEYNAVLLGIQPRL